MTKRASCLRWPRQITVGCRTACVTGIKIIGKLMGFNFIMEKSMKGH